MTKVGRPIHLMSMAPPRWLSGERVRLMTWWLSSMPG